MTEPNTGDHGPGHLGCSTCDPLAGVVPRPQGTAVARVQARGEEFKIVQVVGNLFVCSKANGNCCCGRSEKGRMPFENEHWSDEWERRKIRNQVHLTFTGCLGPCAVGNNALLQLHGQSIWFKDLNDARFAPEIFDYVEQMLVAGHVLPVPPALLEHVYQRYLPTADSNGQLLFAAPKLGSDDLEGLDPVCFMSVDLATATHVTDYEGRTVAFCAASCKRTFLADPRAFVAGARA